ncbi:MAG: PEP-CTERM sorting domain-containing protein [Deltaproteobacteria bacterium]|nr:PEP-CTERM sorting domain-containing protein [Deltaproteobacteria bacterium]
MSINRTFFFTAVILGMIAAITTNASATILFATEPVSSSSAEIVKLDTTTSAVTVVLPPQSTLIDSLFFDPTGRLIFSEQYAGVVLALDLETDTVTTLASGLPFPADMVLDPTLTSFLVSNVGVNNSNNISRVSLTGGLLGSLSIAGYPNGIIYDNLGRLFVNVTLSATDHVVEQIDPITGAVIQQSPNIGFFLDGLTFDSTTGMLFASARDQTTLGAPAEVVQINPSNLNSFSLISPIGAPLQGPDGIVSDGLGNLFIADYSGAVEYDIATHNGTVVANLPFDDIAPASGLGSQPTDVPEPSSLAILAASLAGIGLVGRRRRVT